MDLSTLLFCICIYLILGFLLSILAMLVMDIDMDDYIFAFLMFWPIALIIASVFQLIRFVKTMFKGEN
ncbi:hypothetical protein [Holdemanella biformis]